MIVRISLEGVCEAGIAWQKRSLDKIRKHFFPRLELSARDYLWSIRAVCSSQEFINAHPEIVVRKIQVNLA